MALTTEFSLHILYRLYIKVLGYLGLGTSLPNVNAQFNTFNTKPKA